MLKSIHHCWNRVQNAGIVLGPLSPVPAFFASVVLVSARSLHFPLLPSF